RKELVRVGEFVGRAIGEERSEGGSNGCDPPRAAFFGWERWSEGGGRSDTGRLDKRCGMKESSRMGRVGVGLGSNIGEIGIQELRLERERTEGRNGED
ncbi:hypothetical protein Tco_1221922, partial [Tanacetum coccineum]